jgi:hypothetical protein
MEPVPRGFTDPLDTKSFDAMIYGDGVFAFGVILSLERKGAQ